MNFGVIGAFFLNIPLSCLSKANTERYFILLCLKSTHSRCTKRLILYLSEFVE